MAAHLRVVPGEGEVAGEFRRVLPGGRLGGVARLVQRLARVQIDARAPDGPAPPGEDLGVVGGRLADVPVDLREGLAVGTT